MANGRNKGAKADAGRDPGGFVALPWSVLDSASYASLSHAAKSLLMEVARQFVRDNNGSLLLSSAYLSKRGWNSSDVVTRAKRQLLAAGFIFETVMGHRPNKASWYAVTWRRLDKNQKYDEGTIANFRQGAYTSGALRPKATREQIYAKWRDGSRAKCRPEVANSQTAKKIEGLTPSEGAEETLTAPAGGVEAIIVMPSGGSMGAVLSPSSTPSHGNHLDMPSIGPQIQ